MCPPAAVDTVKDATTGRTIFPHFQTPGKVSSPLSRVAYSQYLTNVLSDRNTPRARSQLRLHSTAIRKHSAIWGNPWYYTGFALRR